MKPAMATGAALAFTMPATLLEAFTTALAVRGEGQFVLVGLHGAETHSYAQMWQRAQRIMQGLHDAGCKAGDKIILDAGDVAHFIPALWAVMLSGIVAVPLSRSQWNANVAAEFTGRLSSLVTRLGRPLILSDSEHFKAGMTRTLRYSDLLQAAPINHIAPTDRDADAVLIATSGTTGQPQLVRLSARAIMHRWWPGDPAAASSTRYIGWTPLDHVMGLGMAAPNYLRKVYLPAELFVRAPSRWLALVQEHRVTHAVMTNFGMGLLANVPADGGYDLSSIQRIGVGAEMIQPATCRRFVEIMTGFGMPPDAIILGYGLSECGPVAGGQRQFRLDELAHDTAALMIDVPTREHAIRIVNDAGVPCGEGEGGHIEVRGPTMTSGYYEDDAANAVLFTDDGWLRTGDLGYLRDGCLCVTGREKETLSVNARKFACNAIDATLAALPGVRFAHVFALGERVGLAYDGDPSLEKLLREACLKQYGLGLAHCLRLPAKALPRTHSGKLQRHRLAALVPALTAAEPQHADGMEARLCAIMARYLGGIRPGPDDNFFERGGDSLGALMFTVAVESELSVNLPPAQFTQDPICRAVARYLQAPAASGLTLVPVQQGTGHTQLYFAPGVWGNNAYASAMAADIGPDISAWTFHLGRTGKHIGSMEALASQCCALIRERQPHGPYHLMGHSFGGILAFEMARQLRLAGEHVATLAIIDTTSRMEVRNFAAARTPIHNAVGIEAGMDALRNMLSCYQQQPADLHVLYVRAKDSPYLSCSDPSGAWNLFAGKGVSVVDVPGDHHSIMRGASRLQVAGFFRDAMTGALPGVFVPPLTLAPAVREHIIAARRASIAGDARGEVESLLSAINTTQDLPFWVYSNAAEAALEFGDTNLARKAYNRALARDPWPMTTLTRFVLELGKRLPQITPRIKAMVDNAPVDSIAAAYCKAAIYTCYSHNEGALAVLDACLAQMPDNVDLRHTRSALLMDLGRPSEALAEIKRALQCPIENDAAFVRLGKTAMKLGAFLLGKRCIEHALSINPYNPEALSFMAVLRRGDSDETLAPFFA